MEELGIRMAADLIGGLFRAVACLAGAAIVLILMIITLLVWILNG